MNESKEVDYSNGFKSGLIDGKARVGQYVIGEECLYSDASQSIDWQVGYETGYCLGANGYELM